MTRKTREITVDGETFSLPDSWHFGGGNVGDNFYTHFIFSDDGEYEIEVYWDEGEDHCVAVHKDTRDIIPVLSKKFHSEKRALRFAINHVKDLTNSQENSKV